MIRRVLRALRAAWLAFLMCWKGWEPDGWCIRWPNSETIKYSLSYSESWFNKEGGYDVGWVISSGGRTYAKYYSTVLEAVEASKTKKFYTQDPKAHRGSHA